MCRSSIFGNEESLLVESSPSSRPFPFLIYVPSCSSAMRPLRTPPRGSARSLLLMTSMFAGAKLGNNGILKSLLYALVLINRSSQASTYVLCNIHHWWMVGRNHHVDIDLEDNCVRMGIGSEAHNLKI